MNRLVTASAVSALLLILGGCERGPAESSADQAAVPSEAASSSAPVAAGSGTPGAEAGSPAAEAEAVPLATTAVPPAAFIQCGTCHSIEPGGKGAGPTLFGIVGRKAGTVESYPIYTPALRGSGVTWDRANLDTWLQSPFKMVPGTRMVLSVPDEARRKAILDYLETLK